MRGPSRVVLVVLAVVVVTAGLTGAARSPAAVPRAPLLPAASWPCEGAVTGAASRARSGTPGVVSGGVVDPGSCPPAAGAERAPAGADDAVWERLAECESSGDWGIDTGNGYYGGLQFSEDTWRDYGGTEFAPQAHLATREEQITVAERVRDDRGGYGSWPACANRLDLPRWGW